MRRLALIALALVASSAAAQTTRAPLPSPPAESVRLQTPIPLRGVRAPERLDPFLPDTLRRAPIQATRRLDRGFDEARPACRKDCAPRYYACLASDDQSTCATSWTRCLSSCSTLVTSR